MLTLAKRYINRNTLEIIRQRTRALIRAILSFLGFKKTYVIYCSVGFKTGNRSANISFLHECRPWMTQWHLPGVCRQAAILAGDPSLHERVSLISISQIGNS